MTATNRRNLILAGSATALILIVAFLTNPDQGAHLKAIKETAALKKTAYEAAGVEVSGVIYSNYLVFSTTSFWGMDTLSYGYFGRVHTSNAIYKATN